MKCFKMFDISSWIKKPQAEQGTNKNVKKNNNNNKKIRKRVEFYSDKMVDHRVQSPYGGTVIFTANILSRKSLKSQLAFIG